MTTLTEIAEEHRKLQPCAHCRDGLMPMSAARKGRASYVCPEYGRDVSLVVYLLHDAGHVVTLTDKRS